MVLLYLGMMMLCAFVGIKLFFSVHAKMRNAGAVIVLIGFCFFVASVSQAQTIRQERAEAQETASDDVKVEDLGAVENDGSADADAESESIASSESAESESIAESESVASRESAASASAASQAEADRIAASESQAASASVEATHQAGAYSDPRPAQAPSTPHYDYAPVPDTAQSETVYVSAAIPGRYHKDPNCRGLQRYGGAQAMTLAQAQAKGYQAFCAYERYE